MWANRTNRRFTSLGGKFTNSETHYKRWFYSVFVNKILHKPFQLFCETILSFWVTTGFTHGLFCVISFQLIKRIFVLNVLMVHRDINFREANKTLVLKLVSCNCPHCSVLKVGQAGTDPFHEEEEHGEQVTVQIVLPERLQNSHKWTGQ